MQKLTSINFHWLSERRRKQPHLSMESDLKGHLKCINVIGHFKLFTAHITSFFGGNKEKLCFNLAEGWSVKQIVNTFSRSYESCSMILKES